MNKRKASMIALAMLLPLSVSAESLIKPTVTTRSNVGVVIKDNNLQHYDGIAVNARITSCRSLSVSSAPNLSQLSVCPTANGREMELKFRAVSAGSVEAGTTPAVPGQQINLEPVWLNWKFPSINTPYTVRFSLLNDQSQGNNAEAGCFTAFDKNGDGVIEWISDGNPNNDPSFELTVPAQGGLTTAAMMYANTAYAGGSCFGNLQLRAQPVVYSLAGKVNSLGFPLTGWVSLQTIKGAYVSSQRLNDGRYQFPEVPPGHYVVTAHAGPGEQYCGSSEVRVSDGNATANAISLRYCGNPDS